MPYTLLWLAPYKIYSAGRGVRSSSCLIVQYWPTSHPAAVRVRPLPSLLRSRGSCRGIRIIKQSAIGGTVLFDSTTWFRRPASLLLLLHRPRRDRRIGRSTDRLRRGHGSRCRHFHLATTERHFFVFVHFVYVLKFLPMDSSKLTKNCERTYPLVWQKNKL